MSDNYGRLLESETSPELKELLYPKVRKCWVCGAELKNNEMTVCEMFHRKQNEHEAMP